MHKDLEDDSWLRDIPHYMRLCSAKKAGEGEGRKDAHSYGIFFPDNCYAWWSPDFLKLAKHLSTDGK